MNQHESDRVDAYLWDPASEPAPEVQAIEKALAAHRFDPPAAPLAAPIPFPTTARARILRSWRPLAAAAAIAAVMVGGLSLWRWTWPDGRAWHVVARPAAVPDRFSVGETLRNLTEPVIVNVARIGTMRIERGSEVTLRSTRSNRHRLALERGRVRVRVWAPAFSVVFATPAGDVSDIGCEFDLSVEDGLTKVRVESGWVQLENELGERLIPAGTQAEMGRETRPGVPVYQDASPEFSAAVRALERGAAAALEQVTALARPRDVLTLLVLLDTDVPGRERIAARAAELWPPPKGVTVLSVLRGDRDALWEWFETLDLPPTKGGWLLNWRDALPVRR